MIVLEKMQVLYVEDERALREEVSRFLSRRVKRVIEAQDGLEALEMVASEQVDLVITDLKMPRMDGLDLARRLRIERPELPIIVLTAVSDAASILEMVDVGIDKYLVKPIDIKRLVGAMKEIAERLSRKKEGTAGLLPEEEKKITEQVVGPVGSSVKRHLGRGPATIKVFIQGTRLMLQLQGSRTPYEQTLLAEEANQVAVDHLRALFYKQIGPYLAHILNRETDLDWVYDDASVDSEMDLDQVFFRLERG